MTNLQKINNKLESQSTSKLKEIIELLNNDYREEVDIIFQIALNTLEKKMEQRDFIEFCESL